MRNVDDRDVEKFLLMLTFLPTEKCKELGSYKDERINQSKEILAFEITKLVHGEEKAKEALETSKALFQKGAIDENMPSTELTQADFEAQKGILTMLTHLGLTKSNGEARRLIQQGGISLNDEKITDPTFEITEDNLNDSAFIIKKGKKVYHRVIIK